MKTTVTLPDELFRRAEKSAERRKISRSKLIAQAVESYLDEYDEQEIIAQINAVCAKNDTSLDPAWKELQKKIFSDAEW